MALPTWVAAAGALIAIACVIWLRRLRAARGSLVATHMPRIVVITALAALVAGVAAAIPAGPTSEPWPRQAAVTALDI